MSAARDVALALLAGRRPQRLPDGGYLVPCPVPSHGRGRGDRNPSLRIGDGETRLLVHCFGGCDPRDVLDVLRRRGLLDDEINIRRHQHEVLALRLHATRPLASDARKKSGVPLAIRATHSRKRISAFGGLLSTAI